jgi:hypothetical protein
MVLKNIIIIFIVLQQEAEIVCVVRKENFIKENILKGN